MERKARNVVAFGQRMTATIRDEAPCVLAATIFIAMMAAFLMILFSKMA